MMSKRWIFAVLIGMCFIMLGMASHQVEASLTSRPLGSFAETLPTMDGTLSTGEWDDASCATEIATGDDGSLQDVTVCVKNDTTNLYMLVEITNADYSDPSEACFDFVRIFFDNDNNGSVEVGENMWAIRFDSAVVTDGFTSLAGGYQLKNDQSFGGSNDLTAAITHSNPGANTIGTYTVEFQAPLDSGDTSHDFSLAPTDTVGFAVHMSDGDPSPTLPCPTNLGSFFLPTASPALGDGFAQLVIADPGIIEISEDVVGDIAVTPGDSVVITNGATVTGDIVINGGKLVIEEGSFIDGDIVGADGGDIVIQGASVVTGDIDHQGGVLIVTNGSTIQGNLIRTTSGIFLKDGTKVEGNVIITGSPFVSIADSTIDGKLVIDDKDAILTMGRGTLFLDDLVNDSGTGELNAFRIDGQLQLSNCFNTNICDDVTIEGIATILDRSEGGSNLFTLQGTITNQAGMSFDVEVMVRTTDSTSISPGASFEVTTSLIPIGETIGGNILIDITGAGVLSDTTNIALTGTNVGQNIVIDITGAGIQSDAVGVSLIDTDVSNKIVIDITGAGIQAESMDVTLDRTSVGQNIVIDITGAGIQSNPLQTSRVKVKNEIANNITDAGLQALSISLNDSTIGGNIKTKVNPDALAGSGIFSLTNSTVRGKIQSEILSVHLSNTTVDKNVAVKNGASITVIDSTLNRNFKVKTAENINLNRGTVGGKILIDNASNVSLLDGSVSGNVHLKNAENVTISGMSVNLNGKRLVVEESLSASVTDNSIDGNLKMKMNQNVVVTGNIISGNLRIIGTTGSCVGDGTNNTVGRKINTCP